jgi:hypothetical protein
VAGPECSLRWTDPSVFSVVLAIDVFSIIHVDWDWDWNST